MATYVLKSPDGSQSFKVTAPDSASPDEVRAYASKQMATAAPAENPEDVAKSKTFRAITSNIGPTGNPDIAMGAKQVWDAAAQGLEHGVEGLFPKGSALGDWLREQKSAETANQETLDAYNKWARPQDQPVAAGLGRGVGQALVTGPATPALKVGGLAKTALQGAGMGAAGGVLTPAYDSAPDDPDFLAKKGQQAKEGAIAGAVAGPALSVAGKALSPVVDAGRSLLNDAGVRMTPGQAAGGFAKSMEDKLTSLPIIGDLINSRRFTGITDFNKAVYAKALEPFKEEGAAVVKAADVGNAGIAKVGDFLSAKYELALSKSVPAPVNAEFQGALANLAQMVPSSLRADFVDTLSRNITSKITPGGTLTPSVARAADSELGRLAASYRGSSVASEREYAMALRQAQEEVRDLFAQSNPSVAPIIDAANQGWRTLVQMENAGAMLGAKDGIFTPSQFLNAVKKSDGSLRDRKFARGEAYNQEFAQAADRILPNKVPDSGTAGRTLAAGLTGAVGGVGGGMLPGLLGALLPGGAAVGGALAAPFLPGVSPMLAKLIAGNRPQSMATLGDLLKQIAPMAGMAGANRGP